MFPFRRSWIAIAVLAVFDVIFIIPAIMVFAQAASGWAAFEDLFDVVTAVFSSAWLLGWSIAPVIMTTVLALMLFGRESIRVQGDTLKLFLGLPLVGIAARYKIEHLRNLRIERPVAKSGRSWRGPHLVFDYGANDVAFGSNITEADMVSISNALERASGQPLRTGDATAQELEGRWEPVDAAPLLADARHSAPAPSSSVTWGSASVLTLILANLVPVAGALWYGWNLGELMVLYWAESAVIGFYNVCKLAVINGWLVLLTGTFFIAHFSAFMAMHFLFIYGIFVQGFQQPVSGELGDVGRLLLSLWPALAALFVSHGISFFRNFIGRGEYRGRSLKQQMAEPYTRIVLMHLVIIFGGGLALLLGSPTPVLLIVIAGKICFDVRAHLRERAKSHQA